MSSKKTPLPLGGRLTARIAALALPMVLLAACATATAPTSNGALSSYSGMTKSDAKRTQASVKVDAATLLAARTLRLEPVAFSPESTETATPAQLALIANAMERTLCVQLSKKFDIVGPQAPADLTVKTTITRIKPTGAGTAGASTVASLLSPIPTPRVPSGLGGFTAEGEATGPAGRQAAAMTWSRDADVFTSGRVSTIGDAYDFSGAFANDLSALLITATDPVHDFAMPKMPRRSKKPPSLACAGYGKGPGLGGFIGARLGAPPEWTDGKKGPAAGRE